MWRYIDNGIEPDLVLERRRIDRGDIECIISFVFIEPRKQHGHFGVVVERE